ncbi:hypothetical protein Scep_003356 [Stephania cephalantha]|uniref:Reverse transcriptase domain-containing protein n=1 Tax=Stephania cephalantha TaxID=152367 RepID=A0AAP0KSC3_9MAGN
MHFTIAKEQNAFVPDRQMLDSVLIATEVIEFASKKMMQAGFILKMDFAKAYDRVDWAFLKVSVRNGVDGCRAVEVPWDVVGEFSARGRLLGTSFEEN